MILSETYQIQDLVYVDNMSDDTKISNYIKHSYRNCSSSKITYNSVYNAYKLEGTGCSEYNSQWDAWLLNSVLDLRNTEITYELSASYQYGVQSGLIIAPPSDDHGIAFAVGEASSNRTNCCDYIADITAKNTWTTYKSYSINTNYKWDTWLKFKIKITEDTQIDYYFIKSDGTEILVQSITSSNTFDNLSEAYIGCIIGKWSHTMYMKNLKIKPLQ